MIETPAALRDRATELHRAGKPTEALPLYAAYLAREPRDAGIWSNLGALFRAQGRHEAALRAQERAHALAPDSVSIMNNLANILNDLGEHERSLALRRRLVASDPRDANHKAMQGKSLRALGRYAESIAGLIPAIEAHPKEAELRIQLALSQLADRRYAEGFRSFRARWETGELKPRAMPTPQWDLIAPIAGKRLLVLPEQGYGDFLAFARFLPVLRRLGPAEVIVLVEKPLARLCAALPGADRCVQVVTAGEHDLWVNLMDLPALHFDDSQVVPAPTALTVPQDSRERAAALVAPHAGRFKVGVIWTGSMTYRGNSFRSFSHRDLLPLTDIPGVQLFSLYKGPALTEFEADGSQAFIVNAGAQDRDFADCAALMQAMDLVVTSDTVTAHLAGSLGVPVWTLLHWDAFWLWQHKGDRTDWYPGMELIRQSRPRDWTGVMDRVAARLTETLRTRKG